MDGTTICFWNSKNCSNPRSQKPPLSPLGRTLIGSGTANQMNRNGPFDAQAAALKEDISRLV
jgi:hypothetical protein